MSLKLGGIEEEVLDRMGEQGFYVFEDHFVWKDAENSLWIQPHGSHGQELRDFRDKSEMTVLGVEDLGGSVARQIRNIITANT